MTDRRTAVRFLTATAWTIATMSVLAYAHVSVGNGLETNEAAVTAIERAMPIAVVVALVVHGVAIFRTDRARDATAGAID